MGLEVDQLRHEAQMCHMDSFLLAIETKNFCAFRKMEKSEFRARIRHLYLKGLTPKEIKAELNEVHGTSAPVFANVYNWVNEFKRDIHIHNMVLSDRRIKVREIVEALIVSQGRVFSILHKNWV